MVRAIFARTSGSSCRVLLLGLLQLSLAPAATVSAQASAPAFSTLEAERERELGRVWRLHEENARQERGGSGSRAFLIEAVGGIGGSLLGFSLVYALSDDCPVEDLGCHIETAFGGIALGTGLSALGTYLAGRAGDTRPSGLGATLGSVVGAAAGLGAWHLFTEELDVVNARLPATLVYSATQGVFSALGSRLVSALR